MPAEKKMIIEELGEGDLLLPELVNDALVANDRIKYYFTLLQSACNHADHPNSEISNLRIEREAAEIEMTDLDTVVGNTSLSDDGDYKIPLAGEIFQSIRSYMQEMVLPLRRSGEETLPEIEHRLASLLAEIALPPDNPVPRSMIERITCGNRIEGDSLHLMVMDLHRLLNKMQSDLSGEVINGARTYLLAKDDRELVAAFMKGVNRTTHLKFDHPGLGTTATRAKNKLIIQNDIGLTDAHVLVITVKEGIVSITYTDVHMRRLQFFQSLFEEVDVVWADTLSRRGTETLNENLYHLSVGTYSPSDPDEVVPFLTYLGSRLVFLIDWNRARKRLRNFLRNRDAIAVLKWAAENEYGHMAFLNLGGERLIYEALDLAAGFPVQYGEPLHQMLGREKTMDYFRWVLRTSSRGLKNGRSRLLIEDEIKAELISYFRSAKEELFAICEEHATLIIEVATLLRDSLLTIQQRINGAHVARNARRVKAWERQADELVGRVRALSRRIEAAEFFFELIGTADDILDYLEEACFYTTLIQAETVSQKIFMELGMMTEYALLQGQEYVKALIAIQFVHRGSSTRDEMQQFLEAVDRMVGLEQDCDEALRNTEKTILEETADFKEMRIAFELARTIEESTNAAMKAAFIIKDNILEGLKE